MSAGDQPRDAGRSEQEWSALYGELSSFLSKRGQSSPYGEGEYWLLDDDYGNGEHLLYLYREDFLSAEIVCEIRKILTRFPQWKVVVSMDVIAWDKNKVPPMGLVISHDGIEDGLRREFLTSSLRDIKFL
jgi:hypothetical protein